MADDFDCGRATISRIMIAKDGGAIHRKQLGISKSFCLLAKTQLPARDHIGVILKDEN
ncbi:hypothetical protein KIN20_023865 [Parelaphostrongylus tenuis]|uniref:Uncharacterized protein n=1 Tax=Parelaphostrongylus tenuis TaxID=148309 RepID=A0AAD5MSN1_PARTN|nr:hypothetical protein KIN20_023865 [Parelaphostrongylus tenuis]